jgi:release factor glutamine methyltransferase
VGQTSFYGLPLLTAPGRVMTPRPASEQLAAAALEMIGDRPARVVDVGTGSGALAIAIASAAPQAVLWATDTSRDAVAAARANVQRHGLTHRITVRRGDLLEPVSGGVDLVVANLPYLPAAEADRFPDLDDEPDEAVFAEGDGLEPYRRLLSVCACRLRSNGAVAIQLHRRVFTATRDELPKLLGDIEAVQRAATFPPQPHALATAA